MKVIYSSPVILGGHGQGTSAYYSVREIYLRKQLKKAFCISHIKKDINGANISIIISPFLEKLIRGFARLFGSANGYWLRSVVYDFFVSKTMDNSNIFHGWSLSCLRSIKRAKLLGAVTVLERPNSHILTQKEILEGEFYKFGIHKRVIDGLEVERNIEEYKLADYVIVPSEFARNSFKDQGFDMKKVFVLPYGVDSTKFKSREKPKDKFRVLFVGQISLRKGVPYLLEAWKKLALKNAELVLVGKVFPEMNSILKQYCQEMRNISVKGFVPYSKMSEEYNSVNLFVFPSLEEGSALVTYEAMACGLPVITTFNSGSQIREGKEGFVVPIRNFEIIAERMNYFYKNPNAIITMGNAGIKRAKEFTWENYGKRLIKFYERINNGK